MAADEKNNNKNEHFQTCPAVSAISGMHVIL